MTSSPQLSVVVPVYNEQESVRPLVEALHSALDGAFDWEALLVDDGSRDQTVPVIEGISNDDPRIRLIQLARNYGQTTAMQAGFDHVRGAIVVSMDGDLQNDPADIPAMVTKLREGFDLVAGYRLHRQDKFLTRKVPSWVANRIIRRLTGVSIRDNGCSLKVYRREMLQRVRLYSDMHRFIPAVSAAIAGARITEVPVRHHARRFGQSKYGLSRVLKVLADLLTILMIRSFRTRPLKLFARGGLAAFGAGIVTSAAAVYAHLYFRPEKVNAVVLPGAALLFFGLSGYLLMLGLIAEQAVRLRLRGTPMQPPLTRVDS